MRFFYAAEEKLKVSTLHRKCSLQIPKRTDSVPSLHTCQKESKKMCWVQTHSIQLTVETVVMIFISTHLREAVFAHWSLRGHQNLIRAKL